MHITKKVIKRSFWIGLFGVALFPAFSVGYYAITQAQARYFPVVSKFHVTERVYHVNGDITISGTFIKNYEDSVCKIVSLKWYAMRSDGPQRKIQYKIGDPSYNKEDRDLAKGEYAFYDWRLNVSSVPYATHVQAVIRHDCLKYIPAVTLTDKINVTRQYGPDYYDFSGNGQ